MTNYTNQFKIIPYDNKYNNDTHAIVFYDTLEGNHILSNLDNLTQDEKYPGVTKVLSHTKDMSGLNEWRKRVGEEEADRIVKESTDIGSSLDMILFNHFKGVDCSQYKNELGYTLYKQMLPSLHKIEPIALQLKVWSNRLKVMGFIDCLCYYDGVLTLLDFKNSKKLKDDKYLLDYYLQCTLYCMMLKDMFNIVVKQIVLMIAIREGSPVPQIKREVHKREILHEANKRVSDYWSSVTLHSDSKSE